ncbi:MAG TPA: FAD synthetase family protein [Candidatus Limnocylindrales bacterium]|nr:FAD synthetase family protein [Candidatus Limnocylindrales bacterium]
MRTARGLEDLERSSEPAFIVVGVFDGLHLGHAYLLEHLVAEAARRDARPMVITFDHHPDEVLTGTAPPLLCDPEERLDLLEAAGVGTTVVVHFDQRLRETTYDAFTAQIADRVPVAGFLMTPDAAFGYERRGTPEALAALGEARGFEVVVVPPFALDGHPVRSSEVRRAIAAGDIGLATRLLGRPHAVVGDAVEGWQGSVVSFPLPVALPPDGPWDVDVFAAGATSRTVAHLADGELAVGGIEPGTRLRVAFLGGHLAT